MGDSLAATVKRLSVRFGLPVDALQGWGVYDLGKGRGVGIRYRDMAGAEMFVRKRVGVRATGTTYQERGVSLAPYGLWKVSMGLEKRRIIIVEGESDCWACWAHGFAALGLPGSGSAHCLQREHLLPEIDTIFVCVEPDEGGKQFWDQLPSRLRALGHLTSIVRLDMPPGIKDIAELMCQDPGAFPSSLEGLLNEASARAGGGPPAPPPPPSAPKSTPEGEGVVVPGKVVEGRMESDYAPGNSVRSLFRLASTLVGRSVSWLHEPWIQRGKLSVVSGSPGAGKSTFGAWLVRHAGRSIILPGAEETPEDELQERLTAARVPLVDVAICDRREWAFPTDRDKLAEAVAQHNAALVWIDPIDGYVVGGSESDPLYIRAALESLVWVAAKTGAAVVFSRHPGKDPRNLLPGSRLWSAVPRAVLELIVDKSRSNIRIIRPDKRSRGREAPATYYHLDGEDSGARVFRWGDPVPVGEVEDLKEEPDKLNRRKIDRAVEMLTRILKEGAVDSKIVLKAGQDEGLGDRCVERAAQRLGVEYPRTGNGIKHRCYYWWPGHGECPLPTVD